jgi:hypothetical protein
MIDLVCTCSIVQTAQGRHVIQDPDCPVHGEPSGSESDATDTCGSCGAEYFVSDGHSCWSDADDPHGEYPPFQPQEPSE